MPRKYSGIDRNRWLKDYEEGTPEASIAADARCDVRTIKKGIEEARRERDARVARIELLKDAMSKHHGALLDRLVEISSSLQVPPRDWTVLSWHRNGDSVFSERESDTEDTPRRAPRKDRGTDDIRSDEAYRMLKQHLKNDKLWRTLARRDRDYRTHRLARIWLQHKVMDILEQKTGYGLESDSNALPPYLCSYTTGDVFYKMTLRFAFGDYKHDGWLRDIVVDSSNCYVNYLNLTLAEVPQKANSCRDKLVGAFREMKRLPELKGVVTTYQELEESTFRARQAIEEIRLSGLVPGQCKVCHRLGM